MKLFYLLFLCILLVAQSSCEYDVKTVVLDFMKIVKSAYNRKQYDVVYDSYAKDTIIQSCHRTGPPKMILSTILPTVSKAEFYVGNIQDIKNKIQFDYLKILYFKNGKVTTTKGYTTIGGESGLWKRIAECEYCPEEFINVH